MTATRQDNRSCRRLRGQGLRSDQGVLELSQDVKKVGGENNKLGSIRIPAASEFCRAISISFVCQTVSH